MYLLMTSLFVLDFAVSFLGRLVKYFQVSGRPQRIILVGNKSDLARNRQVQTKAVSRLFIETIIDG